MITCPASTLGIAGAGAGLLGADAVAVVALRSSTGARVGLLPHPAKLPTISTLTPTSTNVPMTLIILEALGAGILLVAIVWWTMFAGRKNGELTTPAQDEDSAPKR